MLNIVFFPCLRVDSGRKRRPIYRSKRTTTSTINQTGSVQTKREITASTRAT
jgi:hypothetical protein